MIIALKSLPRDCLDTIHIIPSSESINYKGLSFVIKVDDFSNHWKGKKIKSIVLLLQSD